MANSALVLRICNAIWDKTISVSKEVNKPTKHSDRLASSLISRGDWARPRAYFFVNIEALIPVILLPLISRKVFIGRYISIPPVIEKWNYFILHTENEIAELS